MTTNVITTVPRARRSTPAVLVGGAVLIALAGASAGWLLRGPAASATDPVALLDGKAVVPALVADEPEPARGSPAEAEPLAPPKAQPAATPKPAPQRSAARRAAPTGAGSAGTAAPAPLETRPASVCADCGVVASVRPVQRKGDASGVGAVAGGVVGGVIGNQVGKGSGRTAMTVIGAVGGGLAGHEIEKRTRAETVYEVTVRMDDGSERTVTQKSAPAAGTRVVIEGDTARVVETAPAQPRTLRTSTRT